MVKNLNIQAKVGLTDILRENSAYLQPVNGIKAMQNNYYSLIIYWIYIFGLIVWP